MSQGANAIFRNWKFPLITYEDNIYKFSLYLIILISFVVLFFSSITSAQSNPLYYQSYAYARENPDTLVYIYLNQEVPNINAGDIVGQLLFSPISGLIFSVLGGLGGYIIEPSGHDGPSLAVVIGALTGYSIGSAIGVYAVSRKDKYDPDLMALIGSSLLGEIAGVFLLRYANSDYNSNKNIMEWSPLILPPVFAIITLNAFQQKSTNITVGFDVQQLPQPNAYSYGIKLQYEF